VSIDIGTGSGQAVLRRARQNPIDLAVGVDADARAMADASRRAAANPGRGGLTNAMFLAAPAEDMPGPLVGRADLVTVALPWGSLLRTFITPDAAGIRRIASLLRVDGVMDLLVSATERDAAAAGITLSNANDARRLVAALGAAGLEVVECRPAVESDVERLSSAWGKRLGIPARREAWFLRAKCGQLSGGQITSG